MWQHLEDHHRPRRSHRDGQDPRSSRLVHQSTAPRYLRSHSIYSKRLIPTDTRFTPVQPLNRHSPLTFTRARRQTASKFGTEGRSMARKVPASPILDRGLACLTTRLTQQYSSCRRKRVFIFPILFRLPEADCKKFLEKLRFPIELPRQNPAGSFFGQWNKVSAKSSMKAVSPQGRKVKIYRALRRLICSACGGSIEEGSLW
jgi:hypothetical protein